MKSLRYICGLTFLISAGVDLYCVSLALDDVRTFTGTVVAEGRGRYAIMVFVEVIALFVAIPTVIKLMLPQASDEEEANDDTQPSLMIMWDDGM